MEKETLLVCRHMLIHIYVIWKNYIEILRCIVFKHITYLVVPYANHMNSF